LAQIVDMTAGVIAAAAAARALDDLLFAFRAADATAPSRARPPADLNVQPSALLSRLERAGVVLPGDDPTRCYLDERALRAYLGQSRSRATVIAALAMAVLLFVGVLLFLVARR
jgi:hypothetical protein